MPELTLAPEPTGDTDENVSDGPPALATDVLPPRLVVVHLNGENIQITHQGVSKLESPTLFRVAAAMVERELGIQ